MRGLPFDLQGKGALQVLESEETGDLVAGEGGVIWSSKIVEVLEPRSVLDQRRSPSPPTSTSTLSSSQGRTTGSDIAGVAAVSENLIVKWPISGATISCTSTAPAGEAGRRKDGWISELQSIQGALEFGGLADGSEKCGTGVDDWEVMLSESAAPPGHEQTFLHWITGDVGDPSNAKHQNLFLSSESSPAVLDSGSGGPGFSLIDSGFGFDSIAEIVGGPSVLASSFDTALSSHGGLKNHHSAQLIHPTPLPPPVAPGSKNRSFFSQTVCPVLAPPVTLSLPPATLFPNSGEQKRQIFVPDVLIQHQQTHSPPNPSFFPPPSFSAVHDLQQTQNFFQSHHSIPLDPSGRIQSTGGGHELFPRLNHPHSQLPHSRNLNLPQLNRVTYLQERPTKTKSPAASNESAAAAAAAAAIAVQQQQQQAIVDQLFKAAELVEAGNFAGAHGILARLNHQLPSAHGKPLLRSAFFFKEALQLLANSACSPSSLHRTPLTTPLTSPLDVVVKLSAYKAFSEVSPVLQFINFTSTQALLEELGTATCIHIIDFDIGVGGQWSSFMEELAQQRSAAIPLLKITAFVCSSAFHPLELRLTRDNLSHFAAELNIPFEFNISSIDSFNPAEILASCNAAIAVSLPVGARHGPSLPSLLGIVKQLLPKVVISVDQACDRSDLSFSNHFLHSFQSYMTLIDSIDAAGANLDVANKIETFVLQPRIENCVIARHRAAVKMMPWRTLFASAGFVPLQFSNFAEMQAECLLKRVQVRGFHAEKRHSSIVLYWQRGELASVSAWRAPLTDHVEEEDDSHWLRWVVVIACRDIRNRKRNIIFMGFGPESAIVNDAQ
ncbi:Scarecrow-like protein 6 [Apostasia shenzhenica]|uniref:Scarecrow-like protein 6 n=1 Tax=Apostasia shenzhenica TaxID=1088818 RepID=A0A2I0AZW6_9ASPA|nr:Scarecrow-like protein 6 [Apostasia shenzhenica]